jgi:hypothetical protein
VINNQIKEDLYPNLSASTKSGPVNRYWHFISDNMKLHHIVATGQIIEHYGSIKSSDSTDIQAGWIPLFTENNITCESSHEDIIIKIDTASFTGQFITVNSVGGLGSKQFPGEFTSNDQEVYLRAPLPITTISEIIFPSKESKEDFIDRASGYKNENLDIFTLKIKKPPKKAVLKSYSTQLPKIEHDHSLLDHIQTLAAMRGLHFKLANRDSDASITYSVLYPQNELTSPSNDIDVNEILKEALYWKKHGEISPETKHDTNKKYVLLFWNIFKSIADADRESSVYDTVINELNNEQNTMVDGTSKKALITLKDDLIDTRTSTTKNLDQLFEQHPNPFSRALIIFFVRDKIVELVKFKNSQVNIVDLLVASLLFSAREKWKSFSTEMRGYSLFTKEQSTLMATLFHARANTGIEIKSPSNTITPLYDLLLGDSAITSSAKKYRDTRVMVAEGMKWNCIETKITLDKGTYPMVITGSGIEFTFDGIPKSIKTDVKLDEFKQSLAVDGITGTVEEKVREKLK